MGYIIAFIYNDLWLIYGHLCLMMFNEDENSPRRYISIRESTMRPMPRATRTMISVYILNGDKGY